MAVTNQDIININQNITNMVETITNINEMCVDFGDKIDAKVEIVPGMGLSQNNYSDIEVGKVSNIPDDTVQELSDINESLLLKADDDQLQELKDYSFDYCEMPQGTKPPKSGPSTNSFKLIRKVSDNRIDIVQPNNKGYVHYIMEQNFGASGANDYGTNHELLRLTGAYPIQAAYTYFDVSTPLTGAYSAKLYTPGARNVAESGLNYISNPLDANTFTSKPDGSKDGFGAHTLSYGNEVSFELLPTPNPIANIHFIASQT